MSVRERNKNPWAHGRQLDLDGDVTVRCQADPRLCTTAAIRRGKLVEPVDQVALRVGVEASGVESLVDAQGITFFGSLKNGMEVFVSGPAMLDAAKTDNDNSDLFLPDVSVAWAYDPRVLEHVPPVDRVPETPYRLQRAVEALRSAPRAAHFLPMELQSSGERSPPREGAPVGTGATAGETPSAAPSGTPLWIPPRLATLDEVTLCHNIHRYRCFIEEGTALLPPLKTDVYCNGKTSSIATRLSVGAVVDAARRALSGSPAFAFCLVRPPGHHASADTPSGFCLVNNVAIAAMQLLQDWHVKYDCGVGGSRSVPSEERDIPERPRIAIVDIDVHHGEGTQSFVEVEPQLLYLSLHRYDRGSFYPCDPAGATSYVGQHRNICNVAVDTAATDPARCEEVISDMLFARVVDDVFLPRLEQFHPNIILLSLGFDAAHGDPLGRMAVEGGFAYVVRALKRFCLQSQGTIGLVAVLEGGYSPEGVSRGVVSVAHALCYPFDDVAVVNYARLRTPKTWMELRSRLSRRMEVRTDETGGATSLSSGLSSQGLGDATSTERAMADDDVLMERHVAWCDKLVKRVLAIHAESNIIK
ncbi:histone deacetylase 4 [Trypanosoma brucei equiperdum]|uniref:histone deacetylase n=1 Tax=Trypanosoma brucei equiperdum TaxID=630700 RepID=A0A3L6LDP2_9TRYP|nr:histone deacetylase 4 [Trypanosoma brucei equiperdum]